MVVIGFLAARMPWRENTFLGDPEIQAQKTEQDERSS